MSHREACPVCKYAAWWNSDKDTWKCSKCGGEFTREALVVFRNLARSDRAKQLDINLRDKGGKP